MTSFTRPRRKLSLLISSFLKNKIYVLALIVSLFATFNYKTISSHSIQLAAKISQFALFQTKVDLDQTNHHTFIFDALPTPRLISLNLTDKAYSQIILDKNLRSFSQRETLFSVMNNEDDTRSFILEVVGLPLHYFNLSQLPQSSKKLVTLILTKSPTNELILTDDPQQGEPDFFEIYLAGDQSSRNQLVPKSGNYSLIKSYVRQKLNLN